MSDERPRPLRLDELVTKVPPRKPLARPAAGTIERSLYLPGAPEVAVEEVKTGGRSTVDAEDYGLDEDDRTYQVRISMPIAAMGRHASPPSMEVRRVYHHKDIRARQRECPWTEAYFPDHLGRRALPRP